MQKEVYCKAKGKVSFDFVHEELEMLENVPDVKEIEQKFKDAIGIVIQEELGLQVVNIKQADIKVDLVEANDLYQDDNGVVRCNKCNCRIKNGHCGCHLKDGAYVD